jgi:gluconolactonase
MFSSPPLRLETRVAYRLPERFRDRSGSAWVEANQPGVPTHSVLEGPCFDAAGRLHVVDIPYGRIFRIAEASWDLAAEYDGWPNGLKIMPNGHLLVADYRRGLVDIDPADGAVADKLATLASEGFKGLNDLTLGPDGSVLFTDQGQTGLHDPSGRVWRLWPNGRIQRLIDNGPSPNGLVLNRAKTHLYVAMTRSCEIWRFALRDDGLVNKVQCFARVPGGVSGPDGLAVDRFDRLFVCLPAHGQVWAFNAFGEPRLQIVSCAGRTLTNCTFTPDGDALVITDAETGSILTCDLPPEPT